MEDSNYVISGKAAMDWYKEILVELRRSTGFEYEAYKESMLLRRIKNRIHYVNSSGPEEYLKLIKSDDQEMKKIANNFYINVSHFFRDPLVFELFSSSILPEHFNGKSNSIRVWSAGCSTGEEPYSFSIILNEFIELEKLQPEIFFFGTDADTEALNSAEVGIYRKEQLLECKLKYIEKYFTKDGDQYKLSEKIKKPVNFSFDNLLDQNSYAPKESIYGGFDIVLCRNVLIYFNEGFHSRIFDKLVRSVKIGGILVLGEVESIPGTYINNFKQVNNISKIFRRIK